MAHWGRDRPERLPVGELYRQYDGNYSGFLGHMHNLRTSQPQDLMAHMPLNEEMAQRLKSLGKPLDKAGEVREIQTSVEGFVQNLLTVVGLLDSRFICTMIPSGSFYEETKIGSPDEFDFMAEIKVLFSPCFRSSVAQCFPWKTYCRCTSVSEQIRFP